MSKIFFLLSKIAAITGVLFLVISFAPSLWYNLVSGGPEQNAKLLGSTVTDNSPTKTTKKDSYQPLFNPLLPKENRIKMVSVGINTVINEQPLATYENALRIGVWRVPDFGTPTDRSKPMILAAHRFGYLKWTVVYRLTNSFYSLPKLKIGDVAEVDWQQRKYTYAIYAEDKGEAPTDYSADLILYTCEALNSSVRIFKYGRLLEI
jgi:sortase (surface protein transpeptidase)